VLGLLAVPRPNAALDIAVAMAVTALAFARVRPAAAAARARARHVANSTKWTTTWGAPPCQKNGNRNQCMQRWKNIRDAMRDEKISLTERIHNKPPLTQYIKPATHKSRHNPVTEVIQTLQTSRGYLYGKRTNQPHNQTNTQSTHQSMNQSIDTTRNQAFYMTIRT